MTTVSHEIVEWDWMYGTTGNRLHHVPPPPQADTDPEWPWSCYTIRATCGSLLKWAAIPGMFSRMGAPRCSRGCDRLGYPRGVGSPKNDQDCRPLVEARLAALEAE